MVLDSAHHFPDTALNSSLSTSVRSKTQSTCEQWIAYTDSNRYFVDCPQAVHAGNANSQPSGRRVAT
jgi:hypothetical protein